MEMEILELILVFEPIGLTGPLDTKEKDGDEPGGYSEVLASE